MRSHKITWDHMRSREITWDHIIFFFGIVPGIFLKVAWRHPRTKALFKELLIGFSFHCGSFIPCYRLIEMRFFSIHPCIYNSIITSGDSDSVFSNKLFNSILFFCCAKNALWDTEILSFLTCLALAPRQRINHIDERTMQSCWHIWSRIVQFRRQLPIQYTTGTIQYLPVQ